MIPDSKKVRRSSVAAGGATTSAARAASDGVKTQTVEPEVRRPAPLASNVGTPLAGRSAAITESDFTRVAGVPRAADPARELTSALRDDHQLATRLMRASKGPTLDLRDFAAQSIERMSPAAWSALAKAAAGRISSVVLPIGMTTVPDRLAAFGALRQVLLPEFRGARAEVPAGLEGVSISGSSAFKQKVVVVRQDASGSERIDNLAGNLYFRASPQSVDHATMIDRNLNGRATFAAPPSHATGDRIVCRHLSVHWLREKVGHRQAQRDSKAGHVGFNYEKFSSTEKIQSAISAHDETLYERILTGSAKTHVFPLEDWSSFLTDNFNSIKMGETAHFLIESDSHSMAFELRCKADQAGEPRYTVNFYDPNRTTTHLRLTLGRREIDQGWLKRGLEAWLGDDMVRHYFKGAAPLVTVRRVDSASFAAPDASAESLGRDLVLARPLPPSAALLRVLMEGNFPGALKAYLARLPVDPSERVEILMARNSKGMCGLTQACELGNVEVLQVMLAALLDQQNSLGLSAADKVRLLAARSQHHVLQTTWSALNYAVHHGHTAVIAAMVGAILESNLSPVQKLDLLANRDHGVSVRFGTLSPTPEARTAFLDAFKGVSEAQFSNLSRYELGDLIGLAIPLADVQASGGGRGD